MPCTGSYRRNSGGAGFPFRRAPGREMASHYGRLAKYEQALRLSKKGSQKAIRLVLGYKRLDDALTSHRIGHIVSVCLDT
jgi:hypothetical protein